MEKTIKITHEEAVRRWKGLKQQKREFIDRLIKFAKEDYIKTHGKEPESVEVW